MYISISVLLHKMYLQHQVCSSLSIYDFTCTYYNTVSVASVLGSEGWSLYEDLKKNLMVAVLILIFTSSL